MTLPFRRRHNDAEGTHDRARALSSRRLTESLDADEAAWLDRHLDACTECRREDEAFAADHELLRSLHDQPIEPPRDLWARTSAALDIAAGQRPAAGAPSARPSAGAPSARPFWRTIPLGPAAGVFVLLVVIGTALLPGVIRPNAQPSGAVGLGSSAPGPTPITVAAAPIGALRPSASGAFDFVYTDVNAVCPRARPECVAPPAEHQGSSVNLGSARASTLTLSPNNKQLVFEAEGGIATEGKIYVVPVPASGQPSAAPESPTVGPSESSPSTTPSAPTGNGGPTPEPTPTGQMEIASGVTIVGEVAYSLDGHWLAFSAQPKDGSTGPDLYIYAAGSTMAGAVTSDHQTYFSAWLGNKVLASHIAVSSSEPSSPGSSKASSEPGASGQGNNGVGNNGQGNGQAKPIEGRASSFLFDPSNGTRVDLDEADMWMPVVDPHSRFVAYWSGSLRSTDGVDWQLGDGQLVLDGWVDEHPAEASAGTSQAPDASGPTAGPAGHPVPVVTSHVEEFVAKFDPDGIRLAVWVNEHAGGTDGRLHLVVIDPTTGEVRTDQPLAGEPALRRFSIAANRLAWVSPSGQNGQESSLQVLGWSGDDFGEIHSEPAADLLIVK